ncbi:MAG: glycine--tRNA ligase [Candidatus Micrarchaeaceae archaeon]
MTENEGRALSIITRRGIYLKAFGIYGETAGFYDYGPIGLRIKRNIEAAWRRIFVDMLGSLEIEATNIVPSAVLEASGHVATFTDPIVKCSKCGTAYRADKLLEEYYQEIGDAKSSDEVKKLSLEQIDARIKELKIRCEKCGGAFKDAEYFNLLFKTMIGPLGTETGYLRPETAQGIFLEFSDIYRLYGLKLPCSIAQAGKAFRNEISPRQQLIRMREFSQMETELFFDPSADQHSINGFEISDDILKTEINFTEGEETYGEQLAKLLAEGKIPNRFFALVLYLEQKMMLELGFKKDLLRFRKLNKEELPHYSRGNVDLEVSTSYGYIEVAGNAYRGDYDLSAHSKKSGKSLAVASESGKVMPHVVESSIGIDRLLFALLDNSVEDDKRGWEWLRLNKSVAPYEYAVFPLQNDEKLIAKAKDVFASLQKRTKCYYSATGSIGKRYAKADEIGVLKCITIDYTTLEDNTVTIRDRDTKEQIRKKVSEIA